MSMKPMFCTQPDLFVFQEYDIELTSFYVKNEKNDCYVNASIM
jgi:hypothetical protein